MGGRESGCPVPVPPGTPALLFPLTSHQDRSGKAALFPRKTVCIPPDGHPLSSARRACLTSFPHSQSSPACTGDNQGPHRQNCGREVRPLGDRAGAPYKKDPLALKAARGSRTIFGSGLLSHMTLCSIIGDGELNFRVRNGVGCTLSSMATKEICQNIETGMEGFFEKQDARAISTGQLHPSQGFHLQPIDEVVYLGPSGLASGRTYLKAGFPLRCFQRLSLPHIATLLCRWHDNRSTSGVSIPVLSY